MNFSINITQNINIIGTFLVGIASFFSGCVLPILPLYIGYLLGEQSIDENGNRVYKKYRVIINTTFFVLGISTVFFILGQGALSIGVFLNSHIRLFEKIAGVFIIILGLFQLRIIKIGIFNKNKSFMNKFNPQNINFIKAYLMGFLFSFSWTPCIGVTLSSVLIMASTSETKIYGNFLILIYTLGFIIPFIIVSIFTATFFNLLKRKNEIINVMSKVGGVILIIMGILTFSGYVSILSKYFL